jgi:phage terminase Nu1 subunit (DNA packaging protein)
MSLTVEALLGVKEETPLGLADADALADWLNLTPRHVKRLAQEGVIPRAGPNTFDLKASVRAYVRHRLTEKPGVADKARREKAEADLAELKAAQAAGRLLDAGEVEREWAGVLRDVRGALLALPGRLGARLPHLSAADMAMIDSELREALTALGGEDG